MLPASLGALLGCAPSPEPAPVPVLPVEDPDSPCRIGDNALRPECRFTFDEPVSATLTWTAEGESPRSRQASGRDLRFSLWDLPPETPVRWRLEWDGGLEEGVVTTGTLPPEVAVTFVERASTAIPPIDRLLFLAACPEVAEGGGVSRGDRHLVVTDADGVVRWYQPPPVAGATRAFDVDEDSFWMLIDRRTLHRVGFDGAPLTTLQYPDDLPHIGHHDVTARFGQTLMLHARTEEHAGQRWIVDGLTAIRDGAAQAVFTLSDAVPPALTAPEAFGYWGFGGNAQLEGIDYAHANSIDVDEQGRWLISFKHLDSVIAFEGHPDAIDRGGIAFTLVGGPRGVDGGDYALVGPDGAREGFEFPHHARWLGPDRITLFDNGRPRGDEAEPVVSRALTVHLDDKAGLARVERIYELDRLCPVQGSAYPLSDGSMVVFCQRNAQVWVFDEDARLTRSFQVACANDTTSVPFPRMMPLDADYRPILP